MDFVTSIKTCLSKYVTWQGRASRSEYWWFILAVIIAGVVASVLDSVLGLNFKTVNMQGDTVLAPYGYIYALVMLGTFLPSLSAMVRRLHDRNKSGWWYWIVLIPLVGAIILLVWFCSKGTTGANDYGPDPLGGA